MNTSVNIILQNFPHNSEYRDDSFLGLLHEKELWDLSKYNKLKKAIVKLSDKYSSDLIPRKIAWPITRIFSHTMMLIQAHYNASDGFEIKNLSGDELLEYREDLQLTVEKFFSND